MSHDFMIFYKKKKDIGNLQKNSELYEIKGD